MAPDPEFRDDECGGEVMRLKRELFRLKHEVSAADHGGDHIPRSLSQEAVVKASAVAQAVSVAVGGDAGKDGEGKFLPGDQGGVVFWFRDAVASWDGTRRTGEGVDLSGLHDTGSGTVGEGEGFSLGQQGFQNGKDVWFTFHGVEGEDGVCGCQFREGQEDLADAVVAAADVVGGESQCAGLYGLTEGLFLAEDGHRRAPLFLTAWGLYGEGENSREVGCGCFFNVLRDRGDMGRPPSAALVRDARLRAAIMLWFLDSYP